MKAAVRGAFVALIEVHKTGRPLTAEETSDVGAVSNDTRKLLEDSNPHVNLGLLSLREDDNYSSPATTKISEYRWDVVPHHMLGSIPGSMNDRRPNSPKFAASHDWRIRPRIVAVASFSRGT